MDSIAMNKNFYGLSQEPHSVLPKNWHFIGNTNFGYTYFSILTKKTWYLKKIIYFFYYKTN